MMTWKQSSSLYHDTLKCMSQKWNRPVPAIVFTHPQNRKIAKDAANVFAREEFNIVKEKTGRHP